MSLIVLAISAAATLGPAPAATSICGQPRPTPAEVSERARLKRLDRLPPAEAYLTVLRTENGCIRPVLASEERARRR